MKRRNVLAACIAALSAIATATTTAEAQPFKQQGCSAHYLVAVPGGANTAEGIPDYVPHGGNVFMTGILTKLGTAGEIEPVWVSYRSTPFASTRYKQASATGYNKARNTVTRLSNSCPNARFSFTGYSLGADIAARLTSDIAHGRGPIAPEKVSGVALFANPYQGDNGAVLSHGTSPHARGSLGPLPEGYGELGPRVLEICNAGDLVCNMNEAHRGLVSPAMRTNLAAGQIPFAEFNNLFRSLGLGTFTVFHDIRLHGSYTLDQQREASNWIIEQSLAPIQVPIP